MTEQLIIGSTLAIASATARITGALRAEGVRSLTLKGPLQATALYGAPRRPSIDVDILVSPPDLGAAGRVLTSLGYVQAVESTAGVEPDHSSTWVMANSFTIDLHWSFGGADPALFWNVMSSETIRRDVAGAELEVPGAPGTALIAALHAAQHGTGGGHVLEDLAQAVRVIDHDSWVHAAKLADEVAGLDAFRAGLRLLPEGNRLLRTLGMDYGGSLSVGLALRLDTPPNTADGFLWLGKQTGATGRARFLAHKLAPPPAFMRNKYSVATRGRFGLALAYLYRPLWLAWWTPRGYLAWRRAKRASDASRE